MRKPENEIYSDKLFTNQPSDSESPEGVDDELVYLQSRTNYLLNIRAIREALAVVSNQPLTLLEIEGMSVKYLLDVLSEGGDFAIDIEWDEESQADYIN